MKSFKKFNLIEKKIVSESFKGQMWHGTNAKFDKFEQRMARVQNDLYGGGVAYFTDNRKIAEGYAKSSLKRKGAPKNPEPWLYKVDLDLKNIFDIERSYNYDFVKQFVKNDKSSTVEKFLRDAGVLNNSFMKSIGASDIFSVISKFNNGSLNLTGDQLFNAIGNNSANSSKARDIFYKMGYDGLTHQGGLRGGTGGKHKVIIVYDSSKIKIKDHIKL